MPQFYQMFVSAIRLFRALSDFFGLFRAFSGFFERLWAFFGEDEKTSPIGLSESWRVPIDADPAVEKERCERRFVCFSVHIYPRFLSILRRLHSYVRLAY
ncbi:unnamed protein product [Cylicocyclus nassatus]|uniref:Uncharacterized protein n=1 Tax=Cylicocyclus nassatus TaxID=53992 RepID=A0AA36M7N9_CYLNA|nr:unnamed protein product [Cylicocyclus nassatus]